MRSILIPPAPGLFSAFGLLYAGVEHHYGRTFRRLLRGLEIERLNEAWQGLREEAEDQLAAEGFTPARRRIQRLASMHYHGQSFDLTLPVAAGPLDARRLVELEEAFGQEHERTYGHRAGSEEPVELTEIRLIARGVPERPLTPGVLDLGSFATAEPVPARRAYFGPEIGWLDTLVLRRADLATPRDGPCIIEEYDATCVVAPGARARLDPFGNIAIEFS